MNNSQFEDKLKVHANELFGQEKEPPAGHRERFEQRLKEFSRTGNGGVLPSNSSDDISPEPLRHTPPYQRRLLLVATIAAIFAGILFLLNPFGSKQQDPSLADVRNYYSMLLEEKADATRQLIQQVDATNREILLTNVDLIENDPLPEALMPDDEYIILITAFYTYKIEILQNIQAIILENI